MSSAADDLALLKMISRPRLSTYLEETDGDLRGALRLYERNTRLSEAFYSPLQTLEICLRNTLDTCLSETCGTEWQRSGRAPLHHVAFEMIAEAQRKHPPTTASSPQAVVPIIADLKFAFWVSLLGRGYDQTLWRRALYRGFRLPKGMRRSEVHGRFNALRRFRNRVAHHEPVFKRDLLQTHAEVLEAIGWMCPVCRDWAARNSRVVAVLQAT